MMNRFEEKLSAHALSLRRGRLQTLQLNVGRKCNQACRHCHVNAAPWRTEMVDALTAHRIGEWIRRHRPEIVDLTGGAPEMSEFFRYFVETAREAGCHVIDRNNLTIVEEPGYGWLPEYLAAHEVEVIASLPCYSAENVNKQRGQGVFEKSIAALRKLNAAGYGARLPLHLVYNPLGATLPGPQAELEADYKEVLRREFGIDFHRLFTLANQPIARFADDLHKQGRWDEYLELLANSFNPATVGGLMCRTTLSVGYRGEIYDCDFNQMLGMKLEHSARGVESETESPHLGISNSRPGASKTDVGLHLWDVTPEMLEDRAIATGAHCLACTAGSGSSCTGALA